MLYEHTTKPTSTHSHSTAGNGLTKLNKWNHCDLNERQSRSDIQKCTILSPSFHQFISPPSVSFGLCLCWGHPQILSFCFLLTDFSFFTFAFRYTPFPLMCFFCLFLSLISAWNLCGNQPSGHLAVMMADLTAVWRWPLNPQAVALSLCPLSPPALSRHTVLRLFIFENQVKEGLKSTRSKCWSLKKN